MMGKAVKKAIYQYLRSPNCRKRRCLWDALKANFLGNGYHWMVVGDFNALLASSEKKGGRVSGKRYSYFGNFVDSTGVHDFGFKCAPFTCCRSGVYERLDRAIENYVWLVSFPNYFVTHLSRLIADHRPLVLTLQPMLHSVMGSPFRFLARWIEHWKFFYFVKKNGNFNGSMFNTVANFTNQLKEWNKQVYGHIGFRKKKAASKA